MDINNVPLAGTYVLTGLREMAGAFRLEAEGRFSFFYSYGAVDRNAEGRYTTEGNIIKLKSSKEPGKDFSVAEQSTRSNGWQISVRDANSYLASMVRCLCVTGENQEWLATDSGGIISNDGPVPEKIYLQHELFPDVFTQIKDGNGQYNEFIVTLNPSLVQVSFTGIDLTCDGDTLHMLPNYFMPFKDIRFVRVVEREP